MSGYEDADLVESGGIPPTDFSKNIERVKEISRFYLDIPPDFDERLSSLSKDLVVDPELLKELAAALKVGHVVLQGPPGTGKSSLARVLARAYNVSLQAVTAHEDWTTFDVIGRLELSLSDDRKEELVPVNGYFTDAVIRCANRISSHFDDPQEPQAEWLLIDELNRAHLDKAFGELFSVLGTEEVVPVKLPHQADGNRDLVVPRRFRIIATLNSYDKQFVNNLSQAIRRRFTFITIDVPQRKDNAQDWEFDLESEQPAIREFSNVILRASKRVANRNTSPDSDKFEEVFEKIKNEVVDKHLLLIAELFSLAEVLRYAGEDDAVPYLPLGTAQLLDTTELFLTRLIGGDEAERERYLDWAASVKLAPLFEADALDPLLLDSFARSLKSPFHIKFRKALLSISSSGMHFVE